jgi:hypothetical protein
MAEPTTVEAATSVTSPFKSRAASAPPAKKMPPPYQKNAPQKPTPPGSFVHCQNGLLARPPNPGAPWAGRKR